MSASHQDDRWKEKYLALLEAQEAEHTKHSESLELLRRLLVRVSLAADGQDQELDKQLAALREMLREGEKANLRPLAGRLEHAVVALDKRRTARGGLLLQAVGTLIQQALALHPPAEVARGLKRLEKDLRTRLGQPLEQPLVIQELARLQVQTVGALSQQAGGNGGWLSRLFRSTPSARSAQPAPASEPDDTDDSIVAPTCDGVPEHTLLEAPAGVATQGGEDNQSSEATPPFSRIGDTLIHQLHDLLRQIDVPDNARDNADRAKEKLLQGLNWYELVPVLEDISVVVIAALQRHHSEFEGFLQAMDERLSEAGVSISQAREARENSAGHREVLDHEMRQQVADMHDAVATATDLPQLKQGVSSKLDSLLASMDRFQAQQAEGETALDAQLQTLTTRLQSAEQEARMARAALEEQRARLLRDSLTQLPNREAWDDRLGQEYLRWQRYQRPLALLVGDVDRFKHINDSYGHQAGDKVLRIIARTIAGRVRKTDFVARYGGEEFVFLLPETDEAAALSIAEALRQAVEQCPFHFRDERLSITMSFGLSSFREGDSPASVFDRADRALYKAKQSGRNRCMSDGGSA